MGFVSKRKNVRVPRERRLEGREGEREREGEGLTEKFRIRWREGSD